MEEAFDALVDLAYYKYRRFKHRDVSALPVFEERFMVRSKQEFYAAQPFLIAAMIWLIITVPVSWLLAPAGASPFAELKWTAGLWFLCMMDLLAMTRMIASVIRWMSAPSKDKVPLLVQAVYWGTLKVICLVVFAVILIKSKSIPGVSLFLGIATLIVTPLLGGYWWSQRELRHA